MTKADGSAGARRAAALLGIAACAESNHTTMSEDAAKVDVKLTFRHAFTPTKLVTVHAQVKSGKSYRLPKSNGSAIFLQVDQATQAALSGSGTPGLIVWVPPPPMNRLYWFAADSRRARTYVRIDRSQFIRPSLRYDLTRLFEYASWSRKFVSQTMAAVSEPERMTRARAAYKWLKAAGLSHPLVGRLFITRMAWRHITRRAKPTAQRQLALSAAPYLKNLLTQQPDRFLLEQGSIAVEGKTIVERRHILCWYRRALKIGDNSYSLAVRILEVIRYPANWERQPLGVQDISQAATLANWWCKIDPE